jgi:hypothetical protein
MHQYAFVIIFEINSISECLACILRYNQVPFLSIDPPVYFGPIRPGGLYQSKPLGVV